MRDAEPNQIHTGRWLQGMGGAVNADEYEPSAEYVDVMLAEPWSSLGPHVVAGLKDLDPASGPVLDIGAGTGRGVLALAQALPGAEILAVEPSRAMRAVLMALVGSDPDLRCRTTVIAGDLAAVTHPGPFAAAVAINMIGHLDPESRRRLWSTLAARLTPGAPLVVNLQPPSETVAVDLPESTMAAVAVGRRSYHGSGRAEPNGADRVTWHMTYRTVEDGATIRTDRVSYDWWVLSQAGLRDELAVAGFEAVTQVGPETAQLYVARAPHGAVPQARR